MAPNSRDKNGMRVRGNATTESGPKRSFRAEKLAFLVTSEFRRLFLQAQGQMHAR
jgi:hypothetical protein